MSIFSDQYAAMARQMEFSDPRTQELLMLLAKAITGQTYNSLSNDWQTGMNFIGRAIVNSPLGSMAGLSGNNMFGQIHAGIAGAGGIPMMGSGGTYTGHSFGSGANSLSMAYGLTTQATAMASDLGLSGNTVAGYIGSSLSQRGFRPGEVTVRHFDTSAEIMNIINPEPREGQPSSPVGLDERQQRQLRNQAIALAVFEKYKENEGTAMGGDIRTWAATIHTQLKSLNPSQREQAVTEAMRTLRLEGEAPNLSNALLASTEQFIHAGGNLTTVSNKVTEDLKRGLAANAENIRKLTKALGTDNFAELEQVARTLHMGSLRNEQDANRIREHMLDAERTAMTTGRTVQEVLGVQGNMVRILAPVYGGEEFVNQRALMSSMERFEGYERNRRAGHDYRTQQEYIADELAITSNATKNTQWLHVLSYALDNYAGMFTEDKAAVEDLIKEYNDPNTTTERRAQLNREARQFLKPRGMDTALFVREGLHNSRMSNDPFIRGYSDNNNAQTFLDNLLKNEAYANNRESTSSFATYAAALFGRDIVSFDEMSAAMGQGEEVWNSYINGFGLNQEYLKMANAMRDIWVEADSDYRDVLRFVTHRTQQEANLDHNGVVAGAQQDQAFMSSLLARQRFNLPSSQGSDNSVLLGLFGEGGAVSDEAALVYGMMRHRDAVSNEGAWSFKFNNGNVVGADGGDIWSDPNVLKLFGVKSKEEAISQGLTTQAGFTRSLAELHRQGSVISQSSDGRIFVGTRAAAQIGRQHITDAVDNTEGMRVVRGMFTGVNVSNFSYNKATGAYSFTVDGTRKEGAAAMRYLHQRLLQDPTLRKELEFLADPSNGANEATRKQAQQTLTAMRLLDAERSFNFGFNRFEEHWYGNTDERGTLDRLFWDQRNGAANFTDLVNAFLANPTTNAPETMAQRLDFLDAIRGYSKEELIAMDYLDAEGNWTKFAAERAGVEALEGKSANDAQRDAISRASRTEGPSDNILQLLSRVIIGDRLKVTST